jgi:CheY-like chemotaxis protein
MMPHTPTFIVIADDDRLIAELLCTVFDDEGYGVFCCYSGSSAYQAIEQHIPDLVLLDMQMEKRWSGLEVVQRMRAHPHLRTIPVIVYSADSLFLGEVRDKLLAYNCQILEKPFNLSLLLDIVARAISLQERDVGSK